MKISVKVNAWVFDCDGVLLDTVMSKVAAFRAWVPAEHAHLRDEFNRYNLSAFGRSRRLQLQHFYETMLGRAITPDFLDAEVERFACINHDTVRKAGWLPGSREFIEQAAARRIPLFVLSGTPEPELRELLEYHSVSSLFCGIIGSPTTKVQGLNRIVAALAVPRTSVWFVGDATHDFESARETGVGFIYQRSAAAFTADGSVPTVRSLTEISYD